MKHHITVAGTKTAIDSLISDVAKIKSTQIEIGKPIQREPSLLEQEQYGQSIVWEIVIAVVVNVGSEAAYDAIKALISRLSKSGQINSKETTNR